jgi:glycosyltransferase involved in cell wall biosynthesis
MSANNHRVSVIIPVYNDSENLANCLTAVEGQTLDKSKFEVIVVDNGSSQDIGPALKSCPAVKTVFEPKEGSYAARNKGILRSEGDILAFTDSDCIPARDWLEKGLLSLLNKANVGFVAGRVGFFARDERKMTGVEIWEMLYNYDQESFIRDRHFGLTANLFTKRSVMDEVGLFNSGLKSAGDYEWGNRVYDKGFNIYYDEELVVMHPARRTYSQLAKKVRRLIGGQLDVGIINRNECKRKILIDAIPPVLSLYRFLRSDEYNSLDRFDYRVKAISVFIFLRYATVYEMTRLMLGGKSSR